MFGRLVDISPQEGEYIIRIESKYNNKYEVTRDISNENKQGVTLHEVIWQDYRRMVFDVDCKLETVNFNPWNIVEDIIYYTILYIKEELDFDVRYDQFIIMHSNGNEGKTKIYSYHILLDGLSFNRVDCQDICYYIMGRTEYGDYIDSNVYSRNQCIRLLGSIKQNSTRRKVLLRSYTINIDGKLKLFELPELTIKETLVGNTTGCYLCSSGPSPESKVKLTSTQVQQSDVIVECITLLSEHCDAEAFIVGDPYQYQTKSTGRMYHQCILYRVYPSYCPICDREHENQNSWLKIYYGTMGEVTSIIYGCFMSVEYNQGMSIKLGQINKVKRELIPDLDKLMEISGIKY